MKLNPDCIRDVLLFLEENLTLIEGHKFSKVELQDVYKELELKDYTRDEIFYSVYNLYQIRFIDGRIDDVNDIKMFFCEIKNITWNGHQFLNSIRPKSIWDATKAKAKQIGGMSIHTLSTLSMAIMQSVATNPTFIQGIVDSLK